MLKGFVSGEEKDIKRIPMKGKNLCAIPSVSVKYGDLTVVANGDTLSLTGTVTEIGRSNNIWKRFDFVLSAGDYTIKLAVPRSYQSGYSAYLVEYDTGTTLASISGAISEITFTLADYTHVYIGFYIYNKTLSDDKWILMLNTGSQALPYEPYGYQEGWEVRDNQDRLIWGREDELQTATGTLPFKGYGLPVKVKSLLGNAVQNGTPAPDNIVVPEFCGKLVGSDWTIPITNAGQTIPIYLGEVPTVRRVKKLVLDGTENIEVKSGNAKFYIPIPDMVYPSTSSVLWMCSHYKAISNSAPWASYDYMISWSTVDIGASFGLRIRDINYISASAADFKAYLAAQYANGTPVTIWYALSSSATETTISNEPLCKISTYADELTTVQVHGLSAPLYGIGDYKDTLNLSTGVVTRKVKKLVLTGTEGGWSAGTYAFYNNGINPAMQAYKAVICSHYPYYSGASSNTPDKTISTGSGVGTSIWVKDSSFNLNLTDFKAYLAAQYAAGTPVTVWYVLNTPETETVTVPTGMTGEIEGYLTQVSKPSPTNRSVPKWNGEEETGGTYAVTVYTPPEIPTTIGQNTLTVDSNLAPSKLEVSVHAKKIHYGFKIDKSNDDSESAVIYTHDAVTMTPAHMDFTNDRFDYGSWGNAFFVRDCHPVALNLDGTIAYRLDPDDYTKKTDGTASDIFYELLTAAPSDWGTQWKQYYTKSGDEYILNDQVSAPTFVQDTYYKLTYNSSFTGNFMMAFPKVYFRRTEDATYNYVEVSDKKLGDDWYAYAHINTNGQEVDFIYLPLFRGVIVNSKLRSIPGVIPSGGTTAPAEAAAASACGSRWQMWDHSSVCLINDLMTLMSKSIDGQGKFGKGRESGYNSSDTVTYGKLQTGTLVKGGKFKGFSSSYKEVKVFGIEGFWANRWERIQGMLLDYNVWKIKMTPPYNFTGTNFVTLSNASVPSGTGYLSRVQTSQYGSIPASIEGGAEDKFYGDGFYKSANRTCVAMRAGNCDCVGLAGPHFVYVEIAGDFTAWSIGASPVYK